ncbi:MAG TPA: DNA-formamidopyrimidine glycosylase family protein [Gammaproteobacteria bacterium]|nr:DNA-formamidopyrimidine glycosylase family protein [Gammaproteobacteria bacterium]
MPELPDISLYIEALRERIQGRRLERARVVSPFLLRSVEPRIDEAVGKRVVDFRRLGKRIAIGFETDLWLVIHLMIAGRFQWRPTWPDKPSRLIALVLGFDNGTLVLTEAGTKKRASLHVVRGTAALADHDPGGLELAAIGLAEFLAALRSGNHTLKRALTDPRLLSGIGNAYSDEILHRARLSPVMLTSRLSDEDGARLHRATLDVLAEWTERLRSQANGEFPSKVTAFHAEMAVHGRYGLPCPVCGTKVQRIRYADNETNYCPRCQTGGKLLADRSLSRLLKDDWPRSIEELEQLRDEARPR